MANNERERLVISLLPQVIAAIRGWWQRRRERKAQKG